MDDYLFEAICWAVIGYAVWGFYILATT